MQTAEELPEDELERSLRPRRLEDFVGQEPLKEQLGVSIAAARSRGEALDHVLLAGPPGLGKTSLAQIVAAELEVPFIQTAGPALERKGDIAAFLTALEPRSVFFVDEIHRLPRALEETFYPAMEDHCLPITVGQGAGARVVTLDLPPFTLIGATTRAGLLTTPLRDRFGMTFRLEHYEPEELALIVRRAARILGVGALRGGMPVWKYLANRFLTLVENLLLGAQLSEYHTGYRAFSRSLPVRLPLANHSDDFVFDNEILAQIIWLECAIGEVTCPAKYMPEASSINFRRSVRYGFGCLRTVLKYRWAKIQGGGHLFPARNSSAPTTGV